MATGAVKCPVCSGDFNPSEINAHLDQCLDEGWEPGHELRADGGPPPKRTRVSIEAKHGGGAATSGAEVTPKRPAGGVFSLFCTNNNNNNKTASSSKQTPPEGTTRGTASPSNAPSTHPGSDSESRKQRDDAEALRRGLLSTHKPLAESMRPSTLEDYFGQNKVLGEDTLLRAVLQSQEVPSLILWGPPGCGKVSEHTHDVT